MTGRGRTVVGALAALALMGALVVASVPLYALYCRATGFGGTTRIAAGPSPAVRARTMVVRFDTTVMKGMPWQFHALQTAITVRLGEPSLARFRAVNPSAEAITGTAIFNVMPAKAGPYVDKIQCFCFSEQHLEPGQSAELPVSFYIDPAIADDPNTNDVHTITLSYAFFRAKNTTAPLLKSEGAPVTPTKQLIEGAS